MLFMALQCHLFVAVLVLLSLQDARQHREMEHEAVAQFAEIIQQFQVFVIINKNDESSPHYAVDQSSTNFFTVSWVIRNTARSTEVLTAEGSLEP